MDAYRHVIISVGDRIRVEIPVNVESGTIPYGTFKTPQTTMAWGGEEKTLINGFLMEDDTAGSLEALTDCVGVYYTQLKDISNKLYFFSNLGEVYLIEVIPMGIHDHSSIGQGGPAHGTYSSEFDLQA